MNSVNEEPFTVKDYVKSELLVTHIVSKEKTTG